MGRAVPLSPEAAMMHTYILTYVIIIMMTSSSSEVSPMAERCRFYVPPPTVSILCPSPGRVRAKVHFDIRTYIHTHIHTYKLTHIRTYMHTHMHSYAYTVVAVTIK